MSEHSLSWRVIDRVIYNITQDNELKGTIGEAIIEGLLKKKGLLRFSNHVCVCVDLNLNTGLHSAVCAQRTRKDNSACSLQLEPVFEELWRRKNAYEVFNEIQGKLGEFAREIGVEDLDKLCHNLVYVSIHTEHNCRLCGEYNRPLGRVIYLEGSGVNEEKQESTFRRRLCPAISICRKCLSKLSEKGMIKTRRDGRCVPSEDRLKEFALLWFYCKLRTFALLEYIDFIAKIGYIDFFKRTGGGGHSSVFDFVC